MWVEGETEEDAAGEMQVGEGSQGQEEEEDVGEERSGGEGERVEVGGEGGKESGAVPRKAICEGEADAEGEEVEAQHREGEVTE